MAAGELVDDDLVEAVVRERLQQHDWNYGFILDGFPRNRRQAEFFLESYDIDGVIHLDLPDDEVRRRVLARRLCSRCGLDYNLIAHRPETEGRCDVCGGELVTREDDTPEALAARLRDYHDKTDPVLELFRRKEYVMTIDARADKSRSSRRSAPASPSRPTARRTPAADRPAARPADGRRLTARRPQGAVSWPGRPGERRFCLSSASYRCGRPPASRSRASASRAWNVA